MNTKENETIGENYVQLATGYMTIINKYCDVIRKRYAKFIGKEEEWEKETPVTEK
jgi:hypothetical protein